MPGGNKEFFLLVLKKRLLTQQWIDMHVWPDLSNQLPLIKMKLQISPLSGESECTVNPNMKAIGGRLSVLSEIQWK